MAHFKLILLVIIIYINKSVQITNCGISKYNKIIRGTYSIEHAYPWLISLRHSSKIYNNFIGKHFCAGSIISNNYILTAAHCLNNNNNNDLVAIVGIHDLNEELNHDLNVYKIVWIQIHENYNNINNDIALLKVDRPIQFTENVQAICLPNYNDFNDLNEVITAGWGSINGQNTDESLSIKLQETTLKIESHSTCLYNMPLYKENNICALNHKQISNICYGDSGGPLMQYNNNKKWYIYGVSSLALAFQNYSCNPYKPSYFTKISYYLDWIQKNTHKL